MRAAKDIEFIQTRNTTEPGSDAAFLLFLMLLKPAQIAE